jgi:hypothetical protein
MTVSERARRAERLAPYFELQLRLAARMAQLTGAGLGEMALRHTNLHRRLGLGTWAGGPPGPEWRAFALALEATPGLAAQVSVTRDAFLAAPDEVLPQPGQTRYGCFAHEPPDPDGVVRIHFYNLDTDEAGGPLARRKLERRRDELRALTGAVAALTPRPKAIRGASWLYNIEAYRRLFPADYVASRKARTAGINLRGTSTWGQVIDSRERVRPDVRDAVVAGLAMLDPDAPWRAFPLPVLAVSAPIESFESLYGLSGSRSD